MKKFAIVFVALMLCVAVRAQMFDYEYHNRNFFELATDTVSEQEDSVSVVFDSMVVDVLPFAHPMPPAEQSETAVSAAPRKSVAEAAACPIDSVLGYDEDDHLATLTEYAYDALGRTTATVKWQWTDGKKKGISKNEQQYDASGRVVLTANWVWNDAADGWKGTAKTETVYDESGRKTVDMSWTWDDEANDWKGVTKNEYTFNPAGKYTEWVVYSWGTNDWVGKSRITYAYNEAGKQLETVEYTYDAVNKLWVGVTKSEYTYDDAGRNLLALTSNWNAENNQWVPSKKYEYAFSETGNQILDSYYTEYDAENDKWTGKYKKIYAYNEAKKKILDEQYTWNAKTNTWKGTTKTEYEYNAAGKTTLTLKYKWSNDDWVYNTKTESEFDAKNRETDKASYTWTDGVWTGKSRTSTTYTNAGKKETVITYQWTDGDWVKDVLTGYSYSGSTTIGEYTAYWDGSDWVNTTRKEYTFNASGKADATYEYIWDGNDWQYASRIRYIYDDNGTLVITHNAAYTDGKWKMTSMKREDFEYDEAGHTILDATYTCSSDSVWIGDKKDVWTYNTSGTLIYRAAFKYTTDDWMPDYKVEWVYDEAGRKLNEQRLRYSNDNWYPVYWYEFGYDEKGRVIMSSQYSGSGLNWVGDEKKEYKFDDNGQVINETSYTWSDGKWEGIFRYTHVYDASKRETEYITERYADGKWVNDTRDVYDFNAKGLQTINNKYVWLNEDWTYSERSEKEFDTDDDKLRTELSATYENGTPLTYELMKYYYACDPLLFTVRFVDYDGTPLQAESLQEGVTPEYKGETPVREATEYYTFTFKGWKPEVAVVTAAADYVAEYDSTAITYTVRFLNYDGEELQKEELTYNSTPEYKGVTPARDATEYYTFTFKGWKPEVAVVTAAADYVADYDSTAITYTVRFLNYDGEELQKEEMTYGDMPVYTGDLPQRETDEEFYYVFTGWMPDILSVAGAIDYVAQYESVSVTTLYFMVTFYDYDNSLLGSQKIQYGQMPVFDGATPTRESTYKYDYVFKGWSPDPQPVKSICSYKAVYDSTLVNYTVHFVDYDDTPLCDVQTAYGEIPVYNGEQPVRESDAVYSYTFAGWEPELLPVTGEVTYKAVYDASEHGLSNGLQQHSAGYKYDGKYNISGQPVDADYQGIVIQAGVKTVRVK